MLDEVVTVARSVGLAVGPLVVLFALFQGLVLRLPPREIGRIARGTALASIGLLLFLLGVNFGFLPFGRAIGAAIGDEANRWLLVPAGALLGFVTTWGEPSVRILADQVDQASAGSIRKGLVLVAVSFGVAVAVAAGVIRIAYGLPLLYLIVPGYLLVVFAMWWSDRGFLAIAIDAGGVATGPLANTFLLAVAFGVAIAMGHDDLMVHALGLVALIALAPVLSLVFLGLVVRRGRQEVRES